MVGSRFEQEANNGVSHFLEHMLYRGTQTYPTAHDVALAFESQGGSLVATTSSDTGTLHVGMPPRNFEAVLPLFAEVFSAPVFSAINVERGIVREEILEGLDDEGRCICSEDLIRAALFDGHSLGQPISGTLEQLARFDVKGLRQHHERFYCGANTVFAVAGPIDPERVLVQLEDAFSSLPAGKQPTIEAPKVPCGPGFQRVLHRASQTEVTLGFRAPGFVSPDEPAMDLLARVLDDGMATRLYHRLCDERGLCYDVSGDFESYADSGLLELGAETGHGRVVQVVEQLLAIITELRTEGPTREELAAAKSRYRWQLEAMLDSPTQVAEFFLSEELLETRRHPLEREAQLSAVDTGQLQEVANRWLTPQQAQLVLVGYPKKAVLAKVEALLQAFA